MISVTTFLAFAAVAFAMVITPGPNMAYLVSRSICQGRQAGMISLGGIAAGFAVYVLLAAFGITALFAAVPYAYDALRLAGAAYLGYLAWNALRPGGASPFQPRALDIDPPHRLFGMGLLTSLLNPKIAMLYLSLFPQFVDPERGSVLLQSLQLGLTQICISVTVNTAIIFTAGSFASFLATRPLWSRIQRWFMGTVLGLLALRMAFDTRR
ncbi:threonine/homoserine/homoserine lactone efflux protein [Povalibacter uvarum]|uniref:Threonine/homoserine/homoserine lactone efflux protein n=1 Tax=Povalibacter uvarum TaxID=732238 RepID=A0A841HRK7_9GAMM|nr:LysE family translocator [Povalibacter uvarum]MBB6095887.1 threonine/homoserine/homoserine lactone efflux protein [Povalibacter uvarum]